MAFADDGAGYLVAAGAEVRCVLDAAGTKGNALFSEGGSGLYLFSMRGPPGAWVGVSTAEHFGAGWKLKGLFFGGPGNLADGSGLLSGGWGPQFGEGDQVGLRLEQAGSKASVSFSKNGVPLGTAFDIEGWSGGVLRPCVSLDTAGQGVALEVGGAAAELPPLAAFLRARSDEGIEGEWAGRYALKVTGVDHDAWNLAARVGNNLGCRVERAGGGGAVRLAGRVRSTMMMPPPDVYALEQEALRMLEGITALRREGAELVLAGGGAIERFAAAQSPAPVQRDQVHWM